MLPGESLAKYRSRPVVQSAAPPAAVTPAFTGFAAVTPEPVEESAAEAREAEAEIAQEAAEIKIATRSSLIPLRISSAMMRR